MRVLRIPILAILLATLVASTWWSVERTASAGSAAAERPKMPPEIRAQVVLESPTEPLPMLRPLPRSLASSDLAAAGSRPVLGRSLVEVVPNRVPRVPPAVRQRKLADRLRTALRVLSSPDPTLGVEVEQRVVAAHEVARLSIAVLRDLAGDYVEDVEGFPTRALTHEFVWYEIVDGRLYWIRSFEFPAYAELRDFHFNGDTFAGSTEPMTHTPSLLGSPPERLVRSLKSLARRALRIAKRD